MLFGLVQEDERILKTVTERFRSFPVAVGCEWIAGDSFTLGVKPAFQAESSQKAICSRNGLHVILSGEICCYNRSAEDSAGADEQPVAGAALFASLYRQFGSDAVSKTSGHFCAVVLDERNKDLKLFLDRSGGIKTLYYTSMGRGFAFCSSLGLLLAATQLERVLDPGLIRGLFSSGYVLPPRTLVKGVFKLCPGEEVQFRVGAIRRKIVDRIRFDSSAKEAGTADELADRLVDTLARLSVEPETGFLLSGGIDSSVLVALAAQRLGKPVSTFSASFPGSPLDESRYAGIVAKANDCPCNLIDLSHANALDDLPEIVWNLGEPFLDFSAIPTFHLFRQVKNSTSLIISGDGPDHLFCRYYPLAAKRYAGSRYGNVLSALEKLPSTFPQKIRNAAEVPLFEAYRGLFSNPAWGIDSCRSLRELIAINEIEEFGEDPFFAGLEIPRETDLAGFMDAVATIDFYVDGSCGVFAKVGRMAEAQGLTIREPYLDRRVSDYITHLPLHQKQGGTFLHLLASRSRGKEMLKYGVGAKCLPAEIIRKKKGGFTPPLAAWLRESICSLPASRLLSETVKKSGYFNAAVLDRILQEHRDGVRDWSRIIFLVISFDLWVRLFVDYSQVMFPGWKLMELYEQ
jgi:asparagine synthase (glutamine-hydrolysing)